jgi:uncharacterized lipoprotein YbaY
MKNFISTATILRWITPAVILGMTLSFTGCKKDTANKPAPTVTVTPASASNTAGSKVTTSVAVDSPEGGATLAILVNGVANANLPNVTLDGTASQTIPVEFTIPAGSPVGSSFGF